MKELKRNIKIILAVFVSSFIFLIGYFAYAVYFYGGRWFESSYNVRIQSEKKNVIPGNIYDRNGKKLAVTEFKGDKPTRVYPEGSYTAHVVGYDNPNYGRAGAEAFYARYLLGFNNNLIERIYQTLFLPERRGNNVVLTIDARLQESASKALGKKQGAVVLMNARTGEILTMISQPAFDPNAMESEALTKKEQDKKVQTNLFNRATQGYYTPGSIFKIITAASALRYIEGIQDKNYNCEGVVVFNGQPIRDFDKEKHGTIDLNEAFIVSCNTTFAKIGVELGNSRLKKTAEDFGFNEDFLFSDVRMSKSIFQPTTVKEDNQLAWDAVGQGKDIVSPLHMAMIVGSIVNNGIMMEPKLISGVKNIRGYEFIHLNPKTFRRTTTKEVALQLKQMMIDVVKKGTGKNAQIKGSQVGGKTGTAEIFKNSGSAADKTNAWFVGFINSTKDPLVIAVVVEDVKKGTGGSVAAPIAQNVFRSAVHLGY